MNTFEPPNCVKNVIIVNDFAFVNGGASQIAINSAIELSKRGFSVTFFTSVGPVCEALSNSDVKVVHIGGVELVASTSKLKTFFNGIWNFRAAKALSVLLSEYSNADTVIHLHVWCKSLTSSIFSVVRKYQFRSVVTAHDYFTVCPNGGFYNFRQDVACPLKPLSFSCITTNCDSRSYAYKLWRVLRQLVQKCVVNVPACIDSIVAVSSFSRDLILANSSLPESRFTIIPNIINATKEAPATPERSDTILFVGRLEKEKGFEVYADAMRSLPFKAIAIGDGSMYELYKERFPHVHFLGWQSPDAVKEYLRNARLLVFPTLCYETHGLVVSEAAALGVPSVISSGVAAASIFSSDACLLFDRGSWRSLQDVIASAGSDRVRSLGLNAYSEFWSDPPVSEVVVPQLANLYEAVVKAR